MTDPTPGSAVARVAEPAEPAEPAAAATDRGDIVSRSRVMAAGTAVSRVSGFLRASLLLYALGRGVHGDIFTVSNTLPNMLYILLAGGVFNAVLVPQLVRSMRQDPDRGEAYTNRVITLAGLFLIAVTALLILAAPLLVDVVTDGYQGAVQDSTVAFTRYCLPQVLFYGMYVLVGQILNARGSFGPMMWAPIVNNVVSVAVILAYLAAYGAASGPEVAGGYTGVQELLLGLGSTLGIAAQLAILLPYLRRAGFVFRPRLDFRDSGLGNTLRLGVWTVLFVVVNQIAYVVVQRLASGGAVDQGTGATVYAYSFLIVMVPHSIVTVSLATAALPRLSAHAAEGDPAALSRALTDTLRTALTVIVPFAALLPVIAPDLTRLLFAHGAAGGQGGVDAFAPTVSLFGLGVLFFTVHYLVLRGFYAMEQNRVVFFVQCGVAATNVVVAVTLVGLTSAQHTTPSLVLAYAAAYAVGSAVSYALLRRRLGGLDSRRLARFGGRLLLATGVAIGVTLPVARVLAGIGGDGSVAAVARLATVGVLDVALFLVLARLLHIDEVAEILTLGRRRART